MGVCVIGVWGPQSSLTSTSCHSSSSSPSSPSFSAGSSMLKTSPLPTLNKKKYGNYILRSTKMAEPSAVHCVEIERVFCHSDFTWKQVEQFWDLKNSHFDLFSDLDSGNSTLSNVEVSQKIKIQGLQNGQNCSFWASETVNCQIWFHVIWVAVKFWNFHTVQWATFWQSSHFHFG